MNHHAALALAITVLLAACGSNPLAPKGGAAASDPVSRTGAGIAQAATTPLADLNLVNAPIPPVLLEAQRAPYAEPAHGTCAGIEAQVIALDAVLGADLDVPPTPANPSLIERGTGLVGQAAMQQVRGAAESVVPFRSWVRRLSGAERYSRDVAAAIAAGTVRRSYLKGMGVVRGCKAPAAPATAERP
jgi:hypothetical protein